MKKLSTTSFLRAEKYIMTNGRPLEKALFRYYFKDEDGMELIKALQFYQNEDGGFGQGIEPDFWLKDSSPLATSIGLSHLMAVDHHREAKEMIGKAIAYLEKTFDGERFGWYSVPKEVNDYPHAPWWEYDEKAGQTVIDNSWGNPTVELIGYLIRYKRYVKTLNTHDLMDYAIKHYQSESKIDSEHEVYCYIRFYNQLDKESQKALKPKLIQAIGDLINPEVDQWTSYVPMPLNFVEANGDELFNINLVDINKNLDYFIDSIDEYGVLEPVWSWNQYPDEWIVSKTYWTGVLTLNVLMKLKRFNRIIE